MKRLLHLMTVGWMLACTLSAFAEDETLDSLYYEQYVQLKRTMIEMELWEGKIPEKMVSLDKDLRKTWIDGNRIKTIDE